MSTRDKWCHLVAFALHINAQAGGIHKTCTFNKLPRCLVPMDGFYEWKPDKFPVRFVRRKRDVFYVAGLWRMIEKQELDQPVREFSFVLLTMAANASVKPIHDRMPFVVRDRRPPAGSKRTNCGI